MVMSDLLPISPIKLSLEKAQVKIGEHLILNDVSASFTTPEITVITGPNGAGKSTFLSALAGLLPLSKGTRHLTEADGQDAAITRLGYVLQKPVMFRRRVRDNLAIAMKAAGTRHHHGFQDQILTKMGLEGLLDKSAFQLSQGQRQRLAVARVLLMQPGVMMLDEATNSLDQASITILEREVRALADAGMPVLWVTHSRAQAERLADRVIAMEEGKIISDTSAATFFSA